MNDMRQDENLALSASTANFLSVMSSRMVTREWCKIGFA